ncbi:porin [Trinickia terrae]|uniref:porin n=1 Tax=Trinickia terrae TaxID=2571161 RepID=UPI003F70C7EA
MTWCAVGLLASFAVSKSWAQSAVTLYGAVDAGIFFTTKSPGGKGRDLQLMDSGLSPSRFGLKGEEDIGGGTKVGFVLEDGFSVTSGKFSNSNGNLFGRRAFIEVQNNDYGRFRAGVQFSPFAIAEIRSDPRSSSPYETSFTGTIAVPYVQLIKINGLFDSNAITYLTPTIAGLDAQFEYAPGGVAGSFDAGRRLSAALNYNRYGISADLAYYEARDPVLGDVTTRAWTAGAGYTFGPATFRTAFTNFRNPSIDTALSNVSVYSFGGRTSLGPFWAVSAGVYALFDRNVKANKALLFGAGVEYYLSIRTTLYAQAAVVDNKGNMGTGLAITSGVGGLAAGTATGVGVGIRHFF